MLFLEFDNPEFIKGINYTIRLGTKWKDLVIPDDIVRIPNGLAKIKVIHCCIIAEIPDYILDREHDEECRTLHGLIKVMKYCYPDLASLDSKQLEETTVTCLGIWPILKAD